MRVRLGASIYVACAATFIALIIHDPGHQPKSIWPRLPAHAPYDRVPASAPMPPLDPATCVMPVANGSPLPADLGEVWRMVSGVVATPGNPRISIRPYNRGGHYTVDEAGAFVPYDDAVPDSVVAEDGGRYVAVDHEDLLVQDPGSTRYRVLAHSKAEVADYGHPHLALARLPRAGVTLYGDRDRLFLLDGDALLPWKEQGRMQALGMVGLKKAIDLPAFQATLFQSADQRLAVRLDDGRWRPLGDLSADRTTPGSDAEQIRVVTEAPKSDAVLIETNRRTLVLWMPKARHEDARILMSLENSSDPDDSGPHLFASRAAGEILRFQQSSPQGTPLWERLDAGRFVATKGDALSLLRDEDRLSKNVFDIGSRKQAGFMSNLGLVLYRDGAMHLVPRSGPEVIGIGPRIVDMPELEAVWVDTHAGIFEIGGDDALKRVDVPFAITAIEPAISSVPEIGAAIVLTQDGLFSYRAPTKFARVPGGEDLRLPRVHPLPATIPVSHDVLVEANEALHVVVNPSSPRWAKCRSGVAKTSQP